MEKRLGDGIKVALELQPCCGKRSGIGSYTYELVRRLRSGEGLTFSGNLFRFTGHEDDSLKSMEETFPIHICRLFSYGVYRRLWRFMPPYRCYFPQTDVTHFFDFIVPPGVSGKVVTTIYDLTHLRFPETMNPRNLRRIRRGIDGSISRSDKILTISEFSKGELIELLKVEPTRIAVIPPAVSLSGTAASFETVDAKYGLNGTPYLLYMGTIEPRKNLVRLIDAFSLLKKEEGIPHKLLLAGGMGWGTAEIISTARTSSYADDICFTDYISGAEKNALYQNADILVFPSLYEGFGMPILEAMHWGTPVVCSYAASLPEAAGGAAEMVDPYSASGIAEGIAHVLLEPDRRAELISRGLQQEACFSWDESAQRLKQLYRSLC